MLPGEPLQMILVNIAAGVCTLIVGIMIGIPVGSRGWQAIADEMKRIRRERDALKLERDYLREILSEEDD